MAKESEEPDTAGAVDANARHVFSDSNHEE